MRIHMNEIEEKYRQVKNIEYLRRQYGTEQWIKVCGHCDLNGADAEFYCGLVKKDMVLQVFRDCSWDIQKDCSCPGFEGGSDGYLYRANFLDEGFEALLHYRDFFGIKSNYVELSQEFVLLNNLRFDAKNNAYYAMYENGEEEIAVKYEDSCSLSIKLKFLRKYAAAKQMAILLFFDIRTSRTGSLKELGLQKFNEESKSDNLFYDIWGGEMTGPQVVFSVIMGKKIIYPMPVEECGYWPYEKQRQYEEFIIGLDEQGNEITFTSNPNKLANYFGANPQAPHYLTPVFFKREVLQKYIAEPEKYEIRDGHLYCGSLWGMEIDNHHKSCIATYLGDLGRNLPESEQSYWKSYNIVGDEGLSKTSFERDFYCIPSESNMIDHKFQLDYLNLNKEWQKKYQWPLFLNLSQEDQYNFEQIRIPLTDSQPEFDQLVLSLTKVLIDSVNEKAIGKEIEQQTDLKGIGKLQAWIEKANVEGYSGHIQFLKDLQELRSTGTAHSKGKGYKKIADKFEIDQKSHIDVYEGILQKADDFILYMKTMFIVDIAKE